MDANIDYNHISNKQTFTINMNLADGAKQTIDLMNKHCLRFKPDAVRPKWILYTSCGNVASDASPVITANFLLNNIFLAPYLASKSITTFNDLEYTTYNKFNYTQAVFNSVRIQSDATEVAFTSGTILLCMEFVEYQRF